MLLYALSTAVVVPCMTTLVSNHGDANQKGILMGVFRSLGALGRALGPGINRKAIKIKTLKDTVFFLSFCVHFVLANGTWGLLLDWWTGAYHPILYAEEM